MSVAARRIKTVTPVFELSIIYLPHPLKLCIYCEIRR
jgi:hypothetical protein